MRWLQMAVVGAGVALLTLLPGAAAQASDDLEVVIEPRVVDLRLGEQAEVAVTVTNNGTAPTDPLAVHIDITDPRRAGSVDPEDWTATLTREAGVIEAGASETFSWNLRPIGSGRFTVYAVALGEDTMAVHTSQGVDFAVEYHRTLNPEGVLPVVILAPIVVGAALAIQWWGNRRRMRPVPA